MPQMCCKRRELVRADQASDFYCANCGQVVPNTAIPAAARWAGLLAEEELREAAMIGVTTVIEEHGE